MSVFVVYNTFALLRCTLYSLVIFENDTYSFVKTDLVIRHLKS
jgi:hypothetical protein